MDTDCDSVAVGDIDPLGVSLSEAVVDADTVADWECEGLAEVVAEALSLTEADTELLIDEVTLRDAVVLTEALQEALGDQL